MVSQHNVRVIRDDTKQNNKHSMETLINHILCKLLYRPPGYLDKVSSLIKNIFKHVVVSPPDRTFERKALSMGKKWYLKARHLGEHNYKKKTKPDTTIPPANHLPNLIETTHVATNE